MILSSAIRAYVYAEAVDMRKSIDALGQIVAMSMGLNPLSGHVFVFIARRRDKAKLLVWDRHGFWVLYKRLERGRFSSVTAGRLFSSTLAAALAAAARASRSAFSAFSRSSRSARNS